MTPARRALAIAVAISGPASMWVAGYDIPIAIVAILGVGATQASERLGAFAWRPLIFVLLANVLFGVLLVGLPSIGLPAMGMFVAIIVLTLVASMARKGFSWKEALLLGAGLALGSYLAFVRVLQLQFPVWPTFIVQ